jgi:hypothetical protein
MVISTKNERSFATGGDIADVSDGIKATGPQYFCIAARGSAEADLSELW